MSASRACLELSEWETRGPEDSALLAGRFLDQEKGAVTVAKRLAESRLLGLTELRHGLRVSAFSYVGRVEIGNLQVAVHPKIPGGSLLNLLRYAYGYRNLQLLAQTSQVVDRLGFEDLLVAQLNAEVEELSSRGLQRSYIPIDERLSSPSGRIDMQRLINDAGRVSASATLPCRRYHRLEDTPLNRALSAGLELGATITSSLALRRDARRLAGLLSEHVSPISLNSGLIEQLERGLNRLTKNYYPAISIIRLLLEAQGVRLEGAMKQASLPGFLFDMNAFFQALVSKFLRENLPGCAVLDEQALGQMMRYAPNFSPPRRAPNPRPDFIITSKGHIQAILDAKYRDIWERELPREMLYQLVVYAISQPQQPESAIIYPTTHREAREVAIEISDPIRGGKIGRVFLRPVNLAEMETLISDKSRAGRGLREKYARRLAFGEHAMVLM